MDYSWIDSYAAAKPGAVHEYYPEWGAERYLLAGKMFGMRGVHKNGRPIVSLKLEPAQGDLLRHEYEDIIPGYYLNKTHWNSVYLDGKVPAEVIQKMIDQSHSLVLQSLPAKTRRALLGE